MPINKSAAKTYEALADKAFMRQTEYRKNTYMFKPFSPAKPSF